PQPRGRSTRGAVPNGTARPGSEEKSAGGRHTRRRATPMDRPAATIARTRLRSRGTRKGVVTLPSDLIQCGSSSVSPAQTRSTRSRASIACSSMDILGGRDRPGRGRRSVEVTPTEDSGGATGPGARTEAVLTLTGTPAPYETAHAAPARQ